MASVSKAVHRVLDLEGGYSDHGLDPGGETAYGISREYWPDYWDDGEPDWRDAKRFYEEEFWEPLQLGKVHAQSVADEVLDIAVNLGKDRAVKLAQYGYNLARPRDRDEIAVDGVVGPETLGAINHLANFDTKRYVRVLNGLQFCYYLYRTGHDDRVEELFSTLPREDQDVFFRGWMRRITFAEGEDDDA